jgi:hypothetical protein
MHDEELGFFEPRPWHQDRPQRPKVWGDGTLSNWWGPMSHSPNRTNAAAREAMPTTALAAAQRAPALARARMRGEQKKGRAPRKPKR